MSNKVDEESEEKYLAFPKTHSFSNLDAFSFEVDSEKQTLVDSENMSQDQRKQTDDDEPRPQSKGSQTGAQKKAPTPASAGHPKSLEHPLSMKPTGSMSVNEILKQRTIERQKSIVAQQERTNGGSETHGESWLKLSSAKDSNPEKKSKDRQTSFPKEPPLVSDSRHTSVADESRKESKDSKPKVSKLLGRVKSARSSEEVAKKSKKLKSEKQDKNLQGSIPSAERSFHDIEKHKDENEQHDDGIESKELRGDEEEEDTEDPKVKRHTLYSEHVHDPWLRVVKVPKSHKKHPCPVKKLVRRKKSDTSKKKG